MSSGYFTECMKSFLPLFWVLVEMSNSLPGIVNFDRSGINFNRNDITF